MTFRRFFWTHSEIDIQLMRARLHAAGIPTQVRGTASMPGLIGLHGESELWLPEDHWEEAIEVLGIKRRDGEKVGALSLVEAYQSGELSLADDPSGGLSLASCPECGEDWEPGFEVCWNCQHMPE